MARTETLVAEVVAARDAFFGELGRLPGERMNRPGLVGGWGARELVAHLGYWVGYSVEAIQAVENGRADEFGAGRPSVEEINAAVARVARETDLTTVRKREAASFQAFLDRLRRLDPSLLDTPLPHHGLTLQDGLHEDGADHYREHADALRRHAEEPSGG